MKFVYDTKVRPRYEYSFKLTSMFYATRWDFDGKISYIPFEYEGKLSCVVIKKSQEDLKLEVFSESSESMLIENALKIASHVMGFDEDLSEFYELVSNDKILWPVSWPLRGIHLRAAPGVWEGLIISICQQNASFSQGWRMVINFRRLFGRRIFIKEYEHECYAFPSPKNVLNLGRNITSAGVGYRYKTILNVAKAILNDEDPFSVKGVGEYTRRISKIISLRDYSKMPVDRWFRKLIPFAYAGVKEEWSIQKVEEFAEKKWGKWAGLSAIMLTVITAAEPINFLLKKIEKGFLTPIPAKPSPLTLWRYKF